MPYYRYACENCGHEFRVLHLKGVDDDITCPSCGGEDARRLLSRVSVQFKGSGYYRTDRANKKSKTGTKGPGDKDTSAGAGSKESRETKESKSDKPAKSSDNE